MMLIKRLAVALAAAIVWASAQAGVTVLDVELGVSSIDEVRKVAATAGKVKNDGINSWSNGPMLLVEDGDYGIEGLQSVRYIFDADGKMTGLVMQMNKTRFEDIHAILAGKYKLVEESRPFVGDQYAAFSAPGAVIEMNAPHLGFELWVSYLTPAFVSAIQEGNKAEEDQKRAREESKL